MREPAQNFQDLIVWRKAHQLVLDLYRFTRDFPGNEIYILTVQMRRAAVSVPANIAEGFKKKGIADKARLLNIAQGSLEECRYYLILSSDLGYGNTTGLICQLDEVSKLLDAYKNAMLRSNTRSNNTKK